MVNALEEAMVRAKTCIESAYEGLCTVIECQYIKDPVTKIKQQKEVVVLENQPCRLSFEKIAATTQTETAATVSQGVKLFISPEVSIQPGSKILVRQNGMCGVYKASGEPAIYRTHQEIMLVLFKEWAEHGQNGPF